jgi:hypothetical protein
MMKNVLKLLQKWGHEKHHMRILWHHPCVKKGRNHKILRVQRGHYLVTEGGLIEENKSTMLCFFGSIIPLAL